MKETIKILGITLLSLLRILKHSRFPDKLTDLPLIKNSCFVLGNGPSLTEDLKQYANLGELGDVYCVNDFANTALYETMQPNNYVFADPAYWQEDVSENLLTIRKQLFQNILSKTSWSVVIYVPFQGKKYFESMFSGVQNIKLHFYNIIPAEGAKKIVKILYNHGLGMPQVQNVLVAALFLSLRQGHKKIFILGADHSWHETLELDNANRVCFRDKHFYETNAKLIHFTMGGDERTTFTMSQLFSAFAKMFEGYWKIKEYAEFLGVEIYNASSVTYIDAFQRIKPADIYSVITKNTPDNE